MASIPYGFLQRLLHRMVLGTRFVSEFCLELECARTRVDTEAIKSGRHVFIAGLARSGTTMLLRRFYESGSFASLTYRDMPFVLMPRFWRSISQVSAPQIQPLERAHGDGVLVDFDSPEAFEEVFWKSCDGSAYIHSNALVPHRPSAQRLELFCHYIGVILESRGLGVERYLSKNNNNILRLPALCRTLPQSLIVVPFRSPLEQAQSLLTQHRRFTERHATDGFSRDYMGWLGHFEFGSHHKPFRLCGDAVSRRGIDTVDYWLELWNHVYLSVLHCVPSSVVFVSYEALCSDGGKIWNRLFELAGIEFECVGEDDFCKRPAGPLELASAELSASCGDTHRQLLDRHSKMFESSSF